MPPLLRTDGTEFDKARVVPCAQRPADTGVPGSIIRIHDSA